MNRPLYLGLLILDMIKIVMYDNWYDHIKSKYSSFIFHVESEDFYADHAGDVKKRFDTSNYEVSCSWWSLGWRFGWGRLSWVV